jgi:hypothetical protein
MAVSQRFYPPFADDDVDAVALDFDPVLATGETLSSPAVTVSGGFTVGTPLIGTVAADGNFTEAAAGTYVWVLLTATTVGNWTVTFTVTTSAGRTLHRTERVDVVSSRS